MKKVVTVHGINTKGEWQEKVEGVLKPHFECVHIRYPHHRHLGGTQLIFELRVLAAGMAVTTGLFSLHQLTPAWMALLVTLALAHIFARVRRRSVIDYFNIELQRHLLPGERPHLIAHSFGTYLTAKDIAQMERFKVRLDHSDRFCAVKAFSLGATEPFASKKGSQ